MSEVLRFLAAVKGRIERRRAVVWVVRGAAVGAVGALAVQITARAWPGNSKPAMLAAIVTGAIVAAGGWRLARPSMLDIATLADRELGSLERTSTAWQFAGAPGSLLPRQRADAERWSAEADARQVAQAGPKRRELVLAIAAVVAAVLAGILAVAPSPAKARAKSQQVAEADRDRAADEIASLADQVSQGLPGEASARRAMLARQLRAAAGDVRKARTTATAVAALAAAQQGLASLGEAGEAGSDAATAAGLELARSAPSATAGAALAASGQSGAAGASALAAQAMSASTPRERGSAASELRDAADDVADPEVARALREAATSLEQGRSGDAQQALADALQRQAANAGEAAAAGLEGLAAAVPGLPTLESLDLAQALERAAAATAADPRLAGALARAADALGSGEPADAASALKDAAREVSRSAADRQLDDDISRASNRVQRAKEGLLSRSPQSGSSSQSPRQPGSQCDEEQPAASTTTPAAGATAPSTTVGGHGDHGHGCAGQSTGEEQSGGPESPEGPDSDSPSPQSSGQAMVGTDSEGGNQGGGSEGAGGGNQHRGGGATGGGAQGGFTLGPGDPKEQVFVAGLSGPGRARTLPGGGTGPGAPAGLVEYETVYAEYRAAALSQTDRQVVPEQLRDVLRRYFQDAPP